jgi:hypothetical protein
MTTWVKKELERMVKELNQYSNHKYQIDISYGGYRLEKINPLGGVSDITKNERYTKKDFGRFLSDLLEYLRSEKQ